MARQKVMRELLTKIDTANDGFSDTKEADDLIRGIVGMLQNQIKAIFSKEIEPKQYRMKKNDSAYYLVEVSPIWRQLFICHLSLTNRT